MLFIRLGILIENMRREGFELSVSRPKILFKKDNNVYSIEDDKEDVVNEFLDNIDKYSAKIHTIINNIT